jgi:archaellum biogenesis ATPase FlaH
LIAEHDIQFFIIKGLIENKTYFRNVAVNLDSVFFDEDKAPIVKFINGYFGKYDKLPEYSTIVNTVMKSKTINDDLKEEIEEVITFVRKLEFDVDANSSWLFDETKTFANDKAMFLVLKEGAVEISKDGATRDYAKIEKKMRDALSMDWNEDLGLDFFDEDEFDNVYDRLADDSVRIPTGVDVVDNAINGGIPGQTKFLAVIAGSAGLGKTLILGNTAINAVKDGKNVLYISFEISQDELRRRLDAAFTDFSIKNITQLKDKVKKQIVDAKKGGATGRFIIKEFPPASITALDLEAYLNTLHMKRDFKPDVIVLDYLGIMKPCSKESNNSYERGKAVCEEIRAFSDRHKCPVWSAVQTNRGAYGQANVEMDNIADSMGIAHTADLLISLAQPDELKEEDKMKFEIIKSRISKTGSHGLVNIDYDKMKILNTGTTEDQNIVDTINEGINTLKSDDGIS